MGTRSRPLSEITDSDVPTILDDLQLAAELGKTLLERNKELEQAVKHQQNVIEDQSQEIEYLRKQNTALREVNDSRLRIYEQLEVSIQDLERDKHRLAVESASDKKKLKSLSQNVECLESKCDELSKQINELQTLLDMERRKNQRLLDDGIKSTKTMLEPRSFCLNLSLDRNDEQDMDENSIATPTNNEDISAIFIKKSNSKTELKQSLNSDTDTIDSGIHEAQEAQIKEYEELKMRYLELCEKVNELEDQLRLVTEENQALQLKLATVNNNEELKSVQEELSILEEVRQGQMCTRCLRNTDALFAPEDDVSYIGTEDDDEQSLMDLIRCSEPGTPIVYRSTLNIKDNQHISELSSNPYRELVEKYEALLEVQRLKQTATSNETMMSLHDELSAMNSGDFGSIKTGETKSETGTKPKDQRKTPTNMSETETLSSGFAEETWNKATQTESLLSAMANYCEESANQPRFQSQPEYKKLFEEIFNTLKHTPDNNVGEQHAQKAASEEESTVVSNQYEELSECTEDSQSMVSSVVSDQSIAMSECITKTERRKIKKQKKMADREKQIGSEENQPPIVCGIATDGRLVTPYNRDPLLEGLSISSKKRARRSKNKKNKYAKPLESSSADNTQLQNAMLSWTAEMREMFTTVRTESPTPSLIGRYQNESTSEVEFQPSSASKELHKLKKLDLSYAEVLKQPGPRYRSQRANYRKKQNQ